MQHLLQWVFATNRGETGMNKLTPSAAALALLFAGTAQATTINGLSASPNSAALTSGPVTVNLHAAVGHADGVPGSCGVQLDYGDGSMQEKFLIQVSSTGEDRSHIYSKAGSFTASIKGVAMLNPANQMRPACTGAASTPVSIQPAVAGATIVSGSASPNPAKPGENVSHTFNITHNPSIPGACGAHLSYSDGASSEDILIKASDSSIVRTRAYAAKGSYSATLAGMPISPRPACNGIEEAKVSVSTSKIHTLPASEESLQEVGDTPKVTAIETINTVKLSYVHSPSQKYGEFDYSVTSSGANPAGCGYEALLRHTPSGATWHQFAIVPRLSHGMENMFFNLKPGEYEVTDSTPPFPYGTYLLTITPRSGHTGDGEMISACAVVGGKLQTSLYLSAQESSEPVLSLDNSGTPLKPETIHAGTETPVIFSISAIPALGASIPPGTRCNASVIIRDKGTSEVLTSKKTSFPSQGPHDINVTQMMQVRGGFKAGTYEVEASASAENLHNANGTQNNNFNCHGKTLRTLSVTGQGSVIEGVTWSSFQLKDDHHEYMHGTYRRYEIRFMPRISGTAKCSYALSSLEPSYEGRSPYGPDVWGDFDPKTQKVSNILMGILFTNKPSQLFRLKITGFTNGNYSPCKVDGNGIMVVNVTPSSYGTNNIELNP
jgi:hypothetical protein